MNGWTGGQYSLYRFFFGLYLLFHFSQLLPWSGDLFSNQGMIGERALSPLIHLFPNILAIYDSPFMASFLTILGMIGSVFFMAGKWDRISAGLLWYLLACFLGRNPLIANPSLPFVGWLLLAHLFLPTAPYGSLAAKGRDPSYKWGISPSIFFTAWVVMSLAYTYSGVLKLLSPSWVDGTALSHLLQNPLVRPNKLRDLLLVLPPFMLKGMTWGALALEVSFAFLTPFKRIRPWIWLLMVSMHVGLLWMIDFADLTLGMLMVHFFTFDPLWIKPRPIVGKLSIFYDGSCGFCHSFVRFVLSENRARAPFRFAPLESKRADSIMVEEEGRVLYKSEAVFRVLASLGGLWRVIGWLLSKVSTKVSNFIYDKIASIRHRLFAAPKESCPIIPPDLREFFTIEPTQNSF